MTQIHDISLLDFFVPLSAMVRAVGSTSTSRQLCLSVRNPESSILTIQGLIKKPRKVNKGAWRGFRTQLHDLVPQLNNLTHEQMESIIDERNQDFFDNAS
jgi:hypothetical protein